MGFISNPSIVSWPLLCETISEYYTMFPLAYPV